MMGYTEATKASEAFGKRGGDVIVRKQRILIGGKI